MKHRNLRIGWSVTWGVLAVLLVGVWVRSYEWLDVIRFNSAHKVTSFRGHLLLDESLEMYANLRGFAPQLDSPEWMSSYSLRQSLFFSHRDGIQMPYLALVIPIALLAALSWIPLRFSLRTLLIALTLVATVLGFMLCVRRST